MISLVIASVATQSRASFNDELANDELANDEAAASR